MSAMLHYFITLFAENNLQQFDCRLGVRYMHSDGVALQTGTPRCMSSVTNKIAVLKTAAFLSGMNACLHTLISKLYHLLVQYA